MKRRDFLLLAGVLATTWKRAAAEVEIPRIGFVQTGARQDNQNLFDAFRQNLSVLGWKDGGNITVLDCWAEDRTEALPAIVKELIGSGMTVLVTAGTPAALAAKRASMTIPIVLVGVDDPVSLGVVDSLVPGCKSPRMIISRCKPSITSPLEASRVFANLCNEVLGQPGGNVTGLSLTSSEVISERLELLQELVPGLRRLAVIVRDDPGLNQKLQDIRSNAQRRGIEALMLEATTAKALELAFARLRADHSQAIYVASGPLGPVKRARIIALAADSRLPVIYSFRIFAIEGGLISFAADYADLFRRAAGYVDKILKGGNPADLPVEPPRKFGLTVNFNTARALGLTIPPAILARADEVIDQTTESDPSLILLSVRM
jgi:putative ABC transport system substrate-binding protein